MADAVHHPTHLPVTALADDDSKLRQARVTTARSDCEGLDLGGSSGALLQLHTSAKSFQIRWSRVADHRRDVLLGDLVTRMCEAKGQLAVIGEQQQT